MDIVSGRLRSFGLLAFYVALLPTPADAEEVPIGPFVELGADASERGAYAEPAGGPARDGRVETRASTATPRPLWTVQLEQRSLTPPVVAADGTLYVGGERGIVALDADGKRLWMKRVGAVGHSPTLQADGTLLLVAGARLLVMTPQGESSEVAPGFVAASSALRLASGVFAAAAPGGRIHIWDKHGVQLASVPVAPGRHFRLAGLDAGRIAAVGPGRHFSVLSAQAGLLERWRLPHEAVAGPAVGHAATLWTVGNNGVLLGQSPRGRLRAEVSLGARRLPTSPAIGRDGLLRVAADPPALVGLDAGGRERFRLPLDGRAGEITLDRDDLALLVTERGTLYAVGADGTLRFRHGIHARGTPRPVLADGGRIYIADRAGRLTAWR